MTRLLDLPSELTERILQRVKYRDLISLCLCCNRLNAIVCLANEIWRTKFEEEYGQYYKYNYLVPGRDVNGTDWRDEFRQRFLYGSAVRRCIDEVFHKYYLESELSESAFDNFEEFHKKTDGRNGKLMLVDELEKIINDGKPNENLTVKYYASKAIRRFKHEILSLEWMDYVSSHRLNVVGSLDAGVDLSEFSPQDVPGDLVTGAMLIAAWCQPSCHVSEHDVRKEIHSLAKKAILILGQECPDHPLIKQFESQPLSNDEAKNLLDSRFQPPECRQVLTAINQVLYTGKDRYQGNVTFYYCGENSFLDKLIETKLGIPISMCLLYQAIAAKCGVKTYPVNNPGHFVLAWKERSNMTRQADMLTYIDCFQDGLMSSQPTNVLHGQHFAVANTEVKIARPLTVFRRMVSNLTEVGRQQEGSAEGWSMLSSSLELMYLIDRQDMESALLLCRAYLRQNVNQDKVSEILSELVQRNAATRDIARYLGSRATEQLAERTIKHMVIRTRLPIVKYAVGMLMRHKKYHYICVIVSWDAYCAASADWIYRMGVHSLQYKDKQPFYNVLVCDGTQRYAAQENLVYEREPIPIPHTDVGHYFERFNLAAGHYELNEMKRREFPHDEKYRDEFYATVGRLN
ncbi:F-box only protein 21 [Halotydeus destructor]|nr:F-box only protein 21 [Halotydeus destructor]